MFNYPLARRAVFHSGQPHRTTLTRYLLLVALNGFASFQLLSLLSRNFGWPVLLAKITAESVLFLVNFLIQRDFVFTHKDRPGRA
ncbi:GtrA-like protein [compost metagenome]